VDVLLDGRQAIARASREQYDLIICDMKMPGLDGQHFYKTLQRAGIHLPKPFLFVTGDVVSSHMREFLEYSKTPHLAKPFRIEELSEKSLGCVGTLQRRGTPWRQFKKRETPQEMDNPMETQEQSILLVSGNAYSVRFCPPGNEKPESQPASGRRRQQHGCRLPHRGKCRSSGHTPRRALSNRLPKEPPGTNHRAWIPSSRL